MVIDRKVQSNRATLVHEGNGTLGPGLDRTSGPKSDGGWSDRSGHLGYWGRLSLTTQFVAIAALIVCGSMAILGQWLTSQIAAGQVQSRAETGALYMEGFLAPHVQELADGPLVSETHRQQLDALLIDTELAKRLEGMRIWRKDGTVIYSTDKSLTGKKLPSSDIDRAFSGRVVAQLETAPDDEDRAMRLFGYPLLETYAPIYGIDSGRVIAVGEFYESAAPLVVALANVRRKTWGIVGFTTAAIMGLLFVIVREASNVIENQRTKLATQLATAQQMAELNERLRNAADRARMEASTSNENLLNRIGSDIHDGPIQLLSLLILRLGDKPGGRTAGSPLSYAQAESVDGDLSPSALAGQVLSELRELSAGLVLPELESMSLKAALHLAVERHARATATLVDANYSALPEGVGQPLKVCLYRVVQEGLNNAFRHGAAREQRVNASADEKFITIIVSDKGPGLKNETASSAMTKSIGLYGIRNRVEAFGGSLEVRARHRSGTKLVAVIPLDSCSG